MNREFNSSHPPQEVRFVQSVLQQRFDLGLELHGDADSTGYYLYETVQPGGDIGHRVLERIRTIMPVNLDAMIDGKSADVGIIARPLEPGTHSWWPMARYGIAPGIPCSLTLEAGRLALGGQVQAYLEAIEAALGLCSVGGLSGAAVKKQNRGDAGNDERDLRDADARPQALVQSWDQVREPDIQKSRGRERKDIGGGWLQGFRTPRD